LRSIIERSSVAVGIVGAGTIASTVHLPVLKNIPNARICWIADIDGKLASEVGGAYGVASIPLDMGSPSLPPCDVALLAVPVHSRDAWMSHFAKARIPLLVEKPFAITEREHRDYLELFADVPVACGYMRRTYIGIRSLRKIARDGWFGDVKRIRYSEGGRITKTGFSSSTLDLGYRKGGGVLRDLGCHGIDALMFITGANEFQVSTCRIEWDGDTDRQVTTQFELGWGEGGRRGACPVDFSVSWIAEQDNRIEFDFETASVSCSTRPDPELLVRAPGSEQGTGLSLDIHGARSSYQAFYLEWEEFLAAVEKGGAGQFGAATSLSTTRLVEAIYRVGGGQE